MYTHLHFTIIAKRNRLFRTPIISKHKIRSEGMEYAFQTFTNKHPKLKIISIT